MTSRTLRRWFVVHKWTSLVCTLFLLIVCVTGLPLLFSEQIWDTLVGDDDPPYEVLPPGTPNASLDVIVEKARALYPGQIITNVSPDDDEPAVLVSMAPSWQALKDDENYPDRHSGHWIKFDARTAKVLEQSRPADAPKEPRTWTGIIMGICNRLHTSLFAYLLVPQGSTLFGTYNSSVSFGQQRTQVIWTRLIRPDGESIVLDRIPGADAIGQTGLKDLVDQHWGQIFRAALVTTMLSVGSEAGTSWGENNLFQAIRSGASNGFSMVGNRLIDRSMDVQPTLTDRPGLPFTLIVNRDLVLKPWHPHEGVIP